MNSRDAAYDEEEQLRRAIEASKEDAIPETTEPPSRRPKRSRDDSEEYVPEILTRLGASANKSIGRSRVLNDSEQLPNLLPQKLKGFNPPPLKSRRMN